MKILSWNVAGLRACLRKGFLGLLENEDPDIVCLQETKMSPYQMPNRISGYHQYWNCAEQNGYSGTLILSKVEPLAVRFNLIENECATEGRCITVEYEDFYLITVYTPNSKFELSRIKYRVYWENCIRKYISDLQHNKPVILCGDLNVAYCADDLWNPKGSEGSAGYSYEERDLFKKLLNIGMVDAFRYLHPKRGGIYSYWSYFSKSYEQDKGWRIDYFLLSEPLTWRIENLSYLRDIRMSDHCPVVLTLK